ncbi:FAD-binding and (Fe-S)-binding domain-containing protein [Propionicicella superfundia]|uniref:FAD-binding and (Fe-S)-binding domain-containing protein n=1 Tax=Propionicicella superfundia TaxID=348582 RepID=UPI000401F74B|nr:FAD-binding and (Fe-S)-binding domain-containing protein [Propionicicella superfundia]
MDVLGALNTRLESALGRSADSSPLARALYSSDASIYRVLPTAVLAPRDDTELAAAVAAATAEGLPVTARGAGTSCCGNAIGPGLVLDLSRHLTRIGPVDPEARTVTVQPGAVQAAVQRAALPHGLRFGPDPSTADRCTLGGMIGNNACGPRALGYGRTSDNVESVTVVLATGDRMTLGPGSPAPAPLATALAGIARDGADVIAREFGRFSRQISGYALDRLAAGDLPGLIVGSEGTLGIVTSATIRLVRDAPVKTTVVLGYPSMAAAADDIATVLRMEPTACEGLDDRIVDVVRRRGLPVPDLPAGAGWNIVELTGNDDAEVADRARRLVAEAHADEGWALPAGAQALAIWRIRADGAGLASVAFERRAYAGWEDAAVPPHRLGAYLRDFDALLAEHGLRGLPYGHFGDGCVHCRIDFPLIHADGTGRFGRFLADAADLVASHGGSLSGEHGDGRARSALLDRMYSPAAMDLMRRVKTAFDPENLLNPGVLVGPAGTTGSAPPTADVRDTVLIDAPLAASHPRFAEDVHRCSGVGRCLVDDTGRGGVMCPSYQATGREQDSTRGRARVLQEMIAGSVVTDGWAAPEVREALDLCLACKGCARECPTGTDMAAYKSQVLYEAYRGRLRPVSHVSMGWLPLWGRVISRAGLSGIVNRVTASAAAPVVTRLAGVDRRRSLPRFAAGRAASRAATRAATGPRVAMRDATGPRVAIWIDSWTDSFAGSHAEDVATVLAAAGFSPEFLTATACCGLPWITTGQRPRAARELRRARAALLPVVRAGVPVVATEPSCLAVWRSDAADLLPGDETAEVAAGVRSLAEFLDDAGWRPPSLAGRTLVVQPHCHQRAVVGWEADARLLTATGAEVVTVGGCCGLAGNFGFERGHYDVSVAVARHDLLPALEAHPDAIFVGDGFSCRTQVSDLTGRPVATLAQVLAAELRGSESAG